jgi:hypothetical protein
MNFPRFSDYETKPANDVRIVLRTRRYARDQDGGAFHAMEMSSTSANGRMDNKPFCVDESGKILLSLKSATHS